MPFVLKDKFRVWWLQAFLTFISSGFLSLIYFYFVKKHVSFGIIFLADFFGYIFIISFILFFRHIHFRQNIRLGFLFIALGMLILLLPFAPEKIIFPYAILNSLGSIVFFCPYNILYFRERGKGNLQHMTFYWAVGILVGVVAPIIGGFLLGTFKLPVFIFVASVLLFMAIVLTQLVKVDEYKYSLSDLWKHMKGLRTSLVVDGALHRVSLIIVTVFSLRYLKTEINFGLFLSIAALMGIFVAFPMARISDRSQKRGFLIWFFSILSAVLMLSFIWVNSFWLYAFLALSLKAVSSVIDPVRANVVLDKRDASDPLSWISRELFLNIGRLFIIGSTAVLVSFNYLNVVFILLAFLYLIYPFLLHYKKVYYVPVD